MTGTAEVIKFRMRRVYLNNGGYYDGRYFGIGTPVYYYHSECERYGGYVRGDSRETAKQRVRAGYDTQKPIRFYR